MRIGCPIAMDARMLTGGKTGVGSYAHELAQAIAQLAGKALILSDRADLAGPPPDRFGRAGRWLRAARPFPRRARAMPGDMLLAADVFREAQVHFDMHRRLLPVRLPGPPGIMHWTYPVPVRVVGWTNLYTVHDLIPLLHPELTPIIPGRHRRLLDRIVESAAGLITVSECARREIVEVLGCPAAFVHDCSEAVEPQPSTAPLPAGLQRGRYFLALGAIDRRKNLERLCEAHRASGTALPLVLAGPDGWGAESLRPLLAASGAIPLPYQPAETIRALIANARALLMPSLAEGFGLPVVEAMALGTPVLTSDRGALAETAGDAALLVDPTDVGAIAAGIRRLGEEECLRTALIGAGRRNAWRFTRAAFADRLETAYRAAAPQIEKER